MELRQLRYFVTVVEEANFTRAAARLHLTQPGVSAQIRQLERELGQRLLDRSGKAVTLTKVGEAVLPYARAALAAGEGVRRTVEEFTGLLRGHATIGLVSGAAAQELDVAAVLADFHDAHPGVDIALTEDTSERMLAALVCGELDIAVIGLTGEALEPGIAHEVLIDVPLVAAVAPDDPLLRSTGRDGVPLTALRDRVLISLPRGTGLRGVLDTACAVAGFRPRIAFEAAAPVLLAQLAAQGLGVAVVPELSPDAAADLGLRTLPFTDPALRGRIALAWRADGPASPAACSLLARLRPARVTYPAPAPDDSSRRQHPVEGLTRHGNPAEPFRT